MTAVLEETPVTTLDLDALMPLPLRVSHKTIALAKDVEDEAPAPLGHIFTWTYKSLTHDEALVRASKALKALGEDRLHWHEVAE